MEPNSPSSSEKKRILGGRNLVLLGAASILVACVTVGVSLLIYHNSGDIYLDRSRPGYLPDEDEIEEVEENEGKEVYSFEKSGPLSSEILNEYLKEFEAEVKAIDSYEKPFDEEVLSDEHLGIGGEKN